MRVDESRGNDQPTGVDYARRGNLGAIAEKRDAIAGDSDIKPSCVSAGTVNDGAVANQEIDTLLCDSRVRET
jgi:hypothetical protein